MIQDPRPVRFPVVMGRWWVFAILLVTAGAAGKEVPLQEKTWRGRITLVQEKSGHYTGSSESPKPHHTKATYEETFALRLPFRVCGRAELNGFAIEPEFTWTSEKRTTVQSDFEKCLDKHSNPTRRVSPGDFDEKTEKTVGRIDPTTIPKGGFTLLVEADGSYTLLGGGAFRYQFEQHQKSERRFACSGEVSVAETIITPGTKSTVPTPGPDGVLRATIEPLGFNLVFQGEGRITAKGPITGETVIDEQKGNGRDQLLGPLDIEQGEGQYMEKSTARWDLVPIDPCADVRGQFRADLAFLVAYNNAELLNQGLGGKAYDEKVDQFARKLYQKGEGTPGGGDGGEPPPGKDMGVDMDCTLNNAEALREQHVMLCVPEAVFDSILKHEKTHQVQCRRDKAAYKRNFDSALGRSRNEIEAYCAGIQVLISWLDENCRGIEADQRKLVKNLCP